MTGGRRAGAPRAPLIAVLAMLASTGLGAAVAASLPVSGALGAGMATTRCDADGYRVIAVISSGAITSVTVTELSSNCAGASITVEVRAGTSTATSGPMTVPTGGGTFTVTLAAGIPLDPVVRTNAVVR